jgi:hypothetical protein
MNIAANDVNESIRNRKRNRVPGDALAENRHGSKHEAEAE